VAASTGISAPRSSPRRASINWRTHSALAVGLNGTIQLWDMDKLTLEKVDPSKNVLVQPEKSDRVAAKDPENPAKGGDKKVKDSLKVAGAIEPHLSLHVEDEAGLILMTQPNAGFKVFSYPDFKLKGSYKLQGTAYRSAYDRKRRLLYTLAPDPKAKMPAGRFGGHSVHVYALDKVLAGKALRGMRLTPTQVLPLGTFATQLVLSPDGAWLYFLDAQDPKTVKIGRLSTDKGESGGEVALAENTDCLCLSPDGKRLYAGAHVGLRSATKARPHKGSIQVIDAVAMKLDKTLDLPIDPFALDATNAGLVFASGGSGTRTEIAVLDITKAEPVIALWKGVTVGCWIRLSVDQKHLYLSNWRARPAVLTALPLPEQFAGSELPSGATCTAPPISTRGAMTLTPDGRFMVCESGVIIQLRAGE
jgi:hypothetical protein